MADFAVRKIVMQIEEIRHEGGPAPATAALRGAIYAICAQPLCRAATSLICSPRWRT